MAALRTTVSVAALALITSVVFGSGAWADDTAAEIAALKAQLRRLEAHVAAQDRENRQTRSAVQGVVAHGVYTKGPLPVLASTCPPDKLCYKGITFTPGGFLAMETAFRDHATGGDIGTPYGSIAFGNVRTGRPQELRFTARQSRVSGLVEGDVNPTTHLQGYGEFDFLNAGGPSNYNESNSWAPRIRHLYAEVDKSDYGFHLLAGQTWSLATMNAVGIQTRKENIPLTIDAQYVPGFIWARQAQIRAVEDITPDLHVAISAESSSTPNISGNVPNGVGGAFLYQYAGAANNSGVTLSFNHAPDVVGKVAWDPTIADRKIHFEAFGVGRDFYDRFNGNNQDTFTGFGGGSVLVQLWPKVLDAQFSGTYGEGVGRYGTSQLADATVGPNGDVKPLTEYTLLAGLTWHATPQLDIYGYAGREEVERKVLGTVGGVFYGYGNPTANNSGCDIENGACSAVARRVDQVTAGAWYDFYKGAYGNLRGGAQYSYTERTAFSGARGIAPKADDNIFLTSLRYYPF